jgi:GWxTD domain-containing protein
MKKSLAIQFIILLVMPFSLSSQQNKALDVDIARFCASDSFGVVELYYQFHPEAMKKKKVGEDSLISGLLSLKIVDSDQHKVVTDRSWDFNIRLNSIGAETKYSDFTGLLPLTLPDGNYLIEITGKDGSDTLNQNRSTYFIKPLLLKNDSFSISDLQLASSLRKGAIDTSSIFYKNTYEVIPYPSLNYGRLQPVLFFYCELYGLNNALPTSSLKLDIDVIKSENQKVYSKSIKIPAALPSMVLAEAINLRKYANGSYELVLCLSDSSTHKIERTAKKFTVSNPQPTLTQVNAFEAGFYRSEFVTFTEEEIDEIFQFSSYIAQAVEISIWEKLSSLKDKQVFVYRFWKSRDATPGTENNEFKNEYFRHVTIAEQKFGMQAKKGWATDRGRVFCLYGQPDDIQRFGSSAENKPYEIWNYDRIEGGAIFVFADLYGFSDLFLIHSTKRGELRDNDWKRKIEY